MRFQQSIKSICPNAYQRVNAKEINLHSTARLRMAGNMGRLCESRSLASMQKIPSSSQSDYFSKAKGEEAQWYLCNEP